MKTKSNLIEYYENRLNKIKKEFNSDLHNEYVKNAEENLEAVKNGRSW